MCISWIIKCLFYINLFFRLTILQWLSTSLNYLEIGHAMGKCIFKFRRFSCGKYFTVTRTVTFIEKEKWTTYQPDWILQLWFVEFSKFIENIPSKIMLNNSQLFPFTFLYLRLWWTWYNIISVTYFRGPLSCTYTNTLTTKSTKTIQPTKRKTSWADDQLNKEIETDYIFKERK